MDDSILKSLDDSEPHIIDFPGTILYGLKRTVTMKTLKGALESLIPTILCYVKFSSDSSLYVIYGNHNMDKDGQFDCWVALNDFNLQDTKGIEEIVFRAGKTVRYVHKGCYEDLSVAWNTAMTFIKDNNLEVVDNCFEKYDNSPEVVMDDSELHTELYFPVESISP
ncbi:hypothetical protein P9112_005366 [Eukaryota sp. TZLM1-RC]